MAWVSEIWTWVSRRMTWVNKLWPLRWKRFRLFLLLFSSSLFFALRRKDVEIKSQNCLLFVMSPFLALEDHCFLTRSLLLSFFPKLLFSLSFHDPRMFDRFLRRRKSTHRRANDGVVRSGRNRRSILFFQSESEALFQLPTDLTLSVNRPIAAAVILSLDLIADFKCHIVNIIGWPRDFRKYCGSKKRNIRPS